MNRPNHYHLLPTLVSLWSAMIGGAFGALTGMMSESPVLNATLGTIAGFMASVLLSILFMALAQVALSATGADVDDTPIGCGTTSQLSGLIGGVTGLVGAVVLTHTIEARYANEPRTFITCWTASALTALGLMVAVVWGARLRR
jgi:hypothetical protein